MAVFVQLVTVISVCLVPNLVFCSEEIDHRFFLTQLIRDYGTNGSISYEGFERLYQNLGLGNNNNAPKNSELLSRNTRHVDRLIKSRECQAEEELAQVMDLHDEVTTHPSASPTPYPPQCLSAHQLLAVYGVQERNTSLSPVAFLHLCPAIVYELDQGTCSQQASHRHESTASRLKWLYAVSSSVLISLAGIVCVFLIPVLQKSFCSQLSSFFVALAVGTLQGDAFLHLIPHALSSESRDKLQMTGTIFLTVVGLYTFDGVIKIKKHRKEKKKLQDHVEYVTVKTNNSEKDMMEMVKTPSHGQSPSSSSTTSMILFGEVQHSFMDGLAIGGAFAGGTAPGFATSVAVLIHELPHKLGDFAVLLQSGMSSKKALLCNIFLAVVNLVATLIGLAVGDLQNATPWIYAVTAGSFIYISLVTLIPEMSRDQNKWKPLLFRLCGFLLGGAIMGSIALCEPRIQKLFNES